MFNIHIYKRIAASGAAALAMACAAAPAHAQLKINLYDVGGVTGSPADIGFKIAAAYWESVITTNVTVNLDVGFGTLDPGIIGGAATTKAAASTSQVEAALAAGATSSLDASLVLPAITGSTTLPGYGTVGTIDMTRNGPLGTGNLTSATVLDNNDSQNNATLYGTLANLKALGLDPAPNVHDANITFSSAFNFDFNPTDGITAGSMDFIAVAIHEIGHALGFTSGVDTYDYFLGPNGPGSNYALSWDDQTTGNILDLFRYSADGNLDWSVGTASYFSTDGGATAFNGDAYYATGHYNGDGYQTSHFKDAVGAGACDGMSQIGIMDPTFCYGQMGVVKADDLAAFDAIGWSLNVDVLNNPAYSFTTAEAYNQYFGASGVPEPLSWGTMLLGFSVAGGAMRARKKLVRYSMA